MRNQDPNDFPQIGGQGLGVRTLQTFLRENEREIATIYHSVCQRSSTEHLFPVRGKAFYLEVAQMHASYVMVSGKAQATRIRKMRDIFGLTEGIKKEEREFGSVQTCSGPSSSSTPFIQSLESETATRKSTNIAQQHHELQMSSKVQGFVHQEVSDVLAPQTSAIGTSRRFPGSSNITDRSKDKTLRRQDHEKVDGYKKKTNLNEESMQTAARSMKSSLETALKPQKHFGETLIARQPVIKGRLKTLDDHVKVWISGEYRGVFIRKLRSADCRKKARPPISNDEWRTEKHAVKRLFEAVHIVANYLPGKELSENTPNALWDIALNEAYKELAGEKGRKASMTHIKSMAKLKGIDFRCRDPRISR